jgi:hypothetical protein
MHAYMLLYCSCLFFKNNLYEIHFSNKKEKILFLERNYFAYFTEDSHSSKLNKPHVCSFFFKLYSIKKNN